MELDDAEVADGSVLLQPAQLRLQREPGTVPPTVYR